MSPSGPDSISILSVHAASSRILTNYQFSVVFSQAPARFYRENKVTGVGCREIRIVRFMPIEDEAVYKVTQTGEYASIWRHNSGKVVCCVGNGSIIPFSM